jgi:N utilization substance protein A
MNARLAARLTGWKIDITSDTEFAQQEAEAAFGGEDGEEGDFSGRCAAILSNGKRCPNAALPGSKYCGVPAHQALALQEPDEEANPIVKESEPELEAVVSEPEPVTEDAAAFGNPEPEEFPAGPGDAPVPGEDQTLDSGAAHAQHRHVEDDPHAGVPVVEEALRDE